MRASKDSPTQSPAPPLADSFLNLVLELGLSAGLADFGQRFTERAANLLGARAAALALAGADPETLFLSNAEHPARQALHPALLKLGAAISDAVHAGSAERVFGRALAESLGWGDVALVCLSGREGNLLGVLCLADLTDELAPTDRSLLQAMAGYASVMVENGFLLRRIEQSKKQWVEIFDSITDFIVVHDPAGRILRINRSLADFLGVLPSALISRGMQALAPLAVTEEAHACPFCPSGRVENGELLYTVRDRTYLVSTSCIRGGPREKTRTIHVLKDITDRREAERRYRELFNNIQEGLFFSTPDGRFLDVNDALVRMLGYGSREELLQVDLSRELHLSLEHWRRFRAAMDINGALRNFEVALRRKDGSIIYTLQNIFAVRDARGRVVQYRGLMMDVTEQRSFQVQLQRERDFNTQILNNTQSMILVLDTAGLVSYANRRCFEAGLREADLLGRPLADFVPPVRRASLLNALNLTLRGQHTDNLELALLRGDAPIGRFAVNLSPMRDERGSVSSIVVVMTDITDAALLQAKLMHTEKMAALGQLVSGVAHEVNNPLTAIVGFTDLLLESPAIPEAAQKDLRVILQEALRTKQIVQNLLSFARQMPAQREPVHINAVLRQTLQLRAYDLASHGVEVIERLEEELPVIIGDSHQLQQVFLNILNNAYDAVCENGARGQIEVETANRGGCAEILFRDNGPGIAEPERIFEPFFTTKEVGKGTGLGLSICYGIVREHGGEIVCYNTPARPGSTFLVRLPLPAQGVTRTAVEIAQ